MAFVVVDDVAAAPLVATVVGVAAARAEHGPRSGLRGGAMMVAALFVAPDGPYIGLPGVDAWTADRDARRYGGPWPVVAHPPCARWSSLAAINEAMHGLRRGDDGGCFRAALEAVRRFGGVLEHPMNSSAWRAHGLRHPAGIGWQRAGIDDPGWTCRVNQRVYGHCGVKPTWLYAVGVELPSLDWGKGAPSNRVVARDSLRKSPRPVKWMTKSERIHTPVWFRDLLLSMARSVEAPR